MSLIQLLTVGKSLGTVKDRPTSYRMRQQALLPRFGNAEAKPWIYPEPDGGNVGEGEAVVRPSGTAVLLESAGTASTAEPAVAKGPTGAPPESWREARRRRRTTEDRRPWWRRVFGRKPARLTVVDGRGAVQGELGLDMVRVVRNDLMDSDLEVVPVKRRGGGGEKTGVEGRVWGRMFGRFFGVKRD